MCFGESRLKIEINLAKSVKIIHCKSSLTGICMNFYSVGLCQLLLVPIPFYSNKNASVNNLRTSRRDRKNQNWRKRRWNHMVVSWCSLKPCKMYAADITKHLLAFIEPIEYLNLYRSLITNKLDMNIVSDRLPSCRHHLQLDTVISVLKRWLFWNCRRKSFSSTQRSTFIKLVQF